MNIAQSWTVIGILGAFALALVALMAQFMGAKIDLVLTRLATSEANTGAKIDRLDDRMVNLEGKVDKLEGKVDTLERKVDTLDRDVQAIANHVFREGRP